MKKYIYDIRPTIRENEIDFEIQPYDKVYYWNTEEQRIIDLRPKYIHCYSWYNWNKNKIEHREVELFIKYINTLK